METEDPKIALTRWELIRAMREGEATDTSGRHHGFKRDDGYYISNIKAIEEVDFRALVFRHYISFDNCEFDKVTLSACEFESNLTISNSKFQGDVVLYNSVFEKDINVNTSHFEGNLQFKNNIIKGDIRCSTSKIIEEFELLFNEIRGGIALRNISANKNLRIYKCSVKANVALYRGSIGQVLTFRDLEINGAVTFDRVEGEKLFLSSQIVTGNSLRILACNFQEISLPYSIPEKTALKITLTKFKRITTLNGFTNQGYMQWNNMQPLENSFIQIKNAIMGKWDIVDCNFENTGMQIYSSKITDAFYTNSNFPKRLSAPDDIKDEIKRHDILRDGYNQLKTLAQKQNDRKVFLHYQAEELRSYNDTISLRGNTATKIQLFFMWLSNDFGTNWVRAVFFTAVVNLSFFLMTLAGRPLDISKTPKFIGQYFNFLLSLTSKPDFIHSDIETIAFYISRIFVAFGIYQTISAFRKFGKVES